MDDSVVCFDRKTFMYRVETGSVTIFNASIDLVAANGVIDPRECAHCEVSGQRRGRDLGFAGKIVGEKLRWLKVLLIGGRREVWLEIAC